MGHMIEQPAMSPQEFREAQHQLGLSDLQLALVLGLEDPQHIRRLKADAGKSHHRPVKGAHVRLIRAYLAGYRPADWPA
jgi:hypothetical protein